MVCRLNSSTPMRRSPNTAPTSRRPPGTTRSGRSALSSSKLRKACVTGEVTPHSAARWDVQEAGMWASAAGTCSTCSHASRSRAICWGSALKGAKRPSWDRSRLCRGVRAPPRSNASPGLLASASPLSSQSAMASSSSSAWPFSRICTSRSANTNLSSFSRERLTRLNTNAKMSRVITARRSAWSFTPSRCALPCSTLWKRLEKKRRENW
mmetsp:Transcript_1108/g.2658  ORF Transcript_1108/g.2658 Transcript_1108/m.2658 type:complete len:210 (-) Transcript_1108:2712-3341(-)